MLVDLINMLIVVPVDLVLLAAHPHDLLLQAVAHPVEQALAVEGVGEVQVVADDVVR